MLPIERQNGRFDKFLEFRGIDKVAQGSNLEPTSSQPLTVSFEPTTVEIEIEQLDNESDDFYQQESDLLGNNELGGFTITEARDADSFYRCRHSQDLQESEFDSDIEPELVQIMEQDKNFEYKSNGNYFKSDGINKGNNDKDGNHHNDDDNDNDDGDASNTFSDISDNDTNRWEFVHNIPSSGQYDEGSNIASEADSYASIGTNSRSKSFEDGLHLQFVDKTKLLHLNSLRRFKNNLTGIITSVSDSYLVVADNSELSFFEIGQISEIPNKRPKLRFGTQPTFTSTSDRLVSTWPRYPHSINFLKVIDNFCGRQILLVCSDDGNLMIWFSDIIISYIKKLEIHDQEDNDDHYRSNQFNGTKISPNYKIKMESSCWGVDFTMTVDEYGICHNVFVASDNSQSITFLYYHPMDNQFYHIKSHQVLHNIPEVSFLSYTIVDGWHRAKISCASVSQELVIFKVKFRIVMGPLTSQQQMHTNCTHFIDPHMEVFEAEQHIDETFELNKFHRLWFYEPIVLARTLLDEFCWTTKPINSKYFQPVSNLSSVFGNSSLDETKELKRISMESKLLEYSFDAMKSSNPGYGSYFQFYPCLTSLLSQDGGEQEPCSSFSSIDDEYRRIRKGIFKLDRRIANDKNSFDTNSVIPDYEFDFLIVSTASRVGLFSADTLRCNSATSRIFDMRIPCNSETEHCDRISISHLIPDLLCIIVVSQLGLISIFRLCEFKGIYGLRQEHVFPNAATIALSEDGFRTIVGISVRDKSLTNFRRYLLYVVYSDGLVLVYKILLKDKWIE